MGFEIDPSYKEVTERIADFKAKHPDGTLQPLDHARPFWIETVGEREFICYAAAAYRTPTDPVPGVGLAWEPFPGKTPYTKDSELMNAETSAWGRAIVAALASESKSIASANEVRNRRADTEPSDSTESRQSNGKPDNTKAMKSRIFAVSKAVGMTVDDAIASALGTAVAEDDLDFSQCRKVNDFLSAEQERVNA